MAPDEDDTDTDTDTTTTTDTTNPTTTATNTTKRKVVIVGAGASGLQCAAHLVSNCGWNPIAILEARNRTGGRIHSSPRSTINNNNNNNNDNNNEYTMVVDHGAAWVHGTGGDTNNDNNNNTEHNNHNSHDDDDDDETITTTNPVLSLLRTAAATQSSAAPNTTDNSSNHKKDDANIFEPIADGNPWTRPQTLLRNITTTKDDDDDDDDDAVDKDHKLMLYRSGGHRVSQCHLQTGLATYLDTRRKVSQWGQAMLDAGRGRETTQTSLQQAMERVSNHNMSCTEHNDNAADAAADVADWLHHLRACWYGRDADTLPLSDFLDDNIDCNVWTAGEGDFSGAHGLVPTGMATALEPLLAGVVVQNDDCDDDDDDDDDDNRNNIIQLDQRVVRIRRIPDGGVEVLTSDGHVTEADVCVVTLSIGCLQQHCCTGTQYNNHNQLTFFDPPLDEKKTAAIGRMGMATYKKVLLTFESIFWPAEPPFLGLIGSSSSLSSPLGKCLWLDNVWAKKGIPCVEAVLTGQAGQWAIDQPDAVIRDAVLQFMDECLPPRETSSVRPSCIDVHVTRWEEDEYSRGAYASLPLGSSSEDIDTYRQPTWDDRLWFAGDAAYEEYEGSVPAALRSGLQTAEAIHQRFPG